MLTMRLISFIILVFGFAALFGIKFEDVFSKITNRPKSIKDQIDEATNKKKKNIIIATIEEVKDIMRITGRENKTSAIFVSCGVLACVGAVIATIFDNAFLVPVLAAGMMCIPVWYVKLTASHFKKDIADELETALSIISTAYIRNEDIVTAVEENVSDLNSPIREIFEEFVVQLKLIDSDVQKAIMTLKGKIENEVFHEWCDALSACQYDRSLKSTLTPIVAKLSDIKVVNSELELMLAEPRKEFIIMAILVVANIPLMWFLNKDWYLALTTTVIGKIVIAIDLLSIFVSAGFVVKLTKPIEFRR